MQSVKGEQGQMISLVLEPCCSGKDRQNQSEGKAAGKIRLAAAAIVTACHIPLSKRSNRMTVSRYSGKRLHPFEDWPA